MVRCRSLLLLASLFALGSSSPIRFGSKTTTSMLADFTKGDDGPVVNPKMITINDPVMGGESYSTVETEGDCLVWEGEVKIVPFLEAPGFCNLRTEPTNFTAAKKLSETDTVSFWVRADTEFMTPLSVNAQLEGDANKRGGIVYSATLKSREHKHGNTIELYAAWKDFVPTFRGQPVDDAPALVDGDTLDKVDVLGLSTYQSHTAAKFRVDLLQIKVSSTEKYIRGAGSSTDTKQ